MSFIVEDGSGMQDSTSYSSVSDCREYFGDISVGQTVLICTGVTVGGGLAVYAYSRFTGPPPTQGMLVSFAGFTHAGNSVTANLLMVDLSNQLVTVLQTTQVDEDTPGVGTTQTFIPPGYVDISRRYRTAGQLGK